MSYRANIWKKMLRRLKTYSGRRLAVGKNQTGTSSFSHQVMKAIADNGRDIISTTTV